MFREFSRFKLNFKTEDAWERDTKRLKKHFFWLPDKRRPAQSLPLGLWREIGWSSGLPLTEHVRLNHFTPWMKQLNELYIFCLLAFRVFFRKHLSWEHAKARVIFLKLKSLPYSAGNVIFINSLMRFSTISASGNVSAPHIWLHFSGSHDLRSQFRDL